MSIPIKVYNQKAETVDEVKLSDQVFGVKVNEALVHQAMVMQMANERQVLAHTKDRSEVRGGGRKPWRQKGTGRARAGSIRSPIWKGGGITFGPRKDKNFKKKINKKMKQKAMLMVLSDRVANKNLVILDQLEIGEFKTKVFDEILGGLEKKKLVNSKQLTVNSKEEKKEHKNTKTQKQSAPISSHAKAVDEKQVVADKKNKKIKRSILVINDKKDEKVKYSGRNLTGVKIINLNNINILDLLKFRNVILTKNGIKKLGEKYR